jgi:hypothetical protein
MTIVNYLRDRLPRRASSDEGRGSSVRYDRLDAKDVNAELHRHSQVELADIETHERSHGDRRVVLDKLRYLRGKEPLPGYDALDEEGASAALEGADPETIRAVRGYERKFRRRQPVLDALAQQQAESHGQPARMAGR